ncbi:hypothetical protein AYI70_g9901 [Smittium culicis]|uniref:Uncharacterized protein n=1 Tax=Smittium culicis TaxID=133412 RepID=A0A1R1X949_9FUNG|nr:hypothetical protein AYI70_g9901 [Smittium culicis]
MIISQPLPQASTAMWSSHLPDSSPLSYSRSKYIDSAVPPEHFSSGRVNKLDSEQLDAELMSVLEEPLYDSVKLFDVSLIYSILP